MGKLEHLQCFFSSLKKYGPSFGNDLIKCLLVVKSGLNEKAAVFFDENEVDFINGHHVLGSFIGVKYLQKSFLEEKVTEHVSLQKN